MSKAAKKVVRIGKAGRVRKLREGDRIEIGRVADPAPVGRAVAARDQLRRKVVEHRRMVKLHEAASKRITDALEAVADFRTEVGPVVAWFSVDTEKRDLPLRLVLAVEVPGRKGVTVTLDHSEAHQLAHFLCNALGV